jgi:peptide-methionine (S)-S-oxide reductase
MFKPYLFILLGAMMTLSSCAQSKKNQLTKNMQTNHTDTAIFGAGCFWCIEAVFQQLEGVLTVESGYSGGHVANPTYEQVCGKKTGHAEVAKIVYDTTKISFDELLEVFWYTHDPTTPNQQGADIGPQYRSVIFFTSDFQKQRAEYFKKALNDNNAFGKPVVTEIEPFSNYYKAENYHQNYYNNNTEAGYCRFVIKPKLEKFEKAFKDKLKHQ